MSSPSSFMHGFLDDLFKRCERLKVSPVIRNTAADKKRPIVYIWWSLKLITLESYKLLFFDHLSGLNIDKGLFTWREGAPANRATRLEGLTHSPPLITWNSPNWDSEWAAWAILWAAAKHNKQNGRQRKLFSILFQLPARALACSVAETRLLHWYLQTDCHSFRQIALANGNYEKIYLAPPCLRGLSHLGKAG